VLGALVRIGMNGHGLHAQAAQRAEDAAGDLAPIGDEERSNGRRELLDLADLDETLGELSDRSSGESAVATQGAGMG
jgi:hypothetical protein